MAVMGGIGSSVKLADTKPTYPDRQAGQPKTIVSKPKPQPKLPPRTSSGGGSTSGGGGSRSSGGGSSSGGGGGSSASTAASQAEAARAKQLDELRRSIEATPLDPNLIAQFAERERMARRSVEEANIYAEQARGQSALDFEQFLAQLGQQSEQAMYGLRGEAAARNLAFQPAFVGVGTRDIRDQAATAQTQAEQQRATFLTGIQRQIAQAMQARDAELAAVEREKTRAQADHRNFIQTQLASLQY